MFKIAILLFKAALAGDPSNIGAYNELGTAYNAIGKREEAISIFREGLKVDPNYAKIHNNLAIAYYHKGRYDLAIEHCDKAASLGLEIHSDFLKHLAPHR